MSLADLLATQNISSAIIVDDANDEVPTAFDIGPAANGAWSNFSDDLSPEGRAIIAEHFPVEGRRLDDLVLDDEYVATIWKLRDQLGAAALQVFEDYDQRLETDKRYVGLVKDKLEAQGIKCDTAGREFASKATDVDLIVIDLFLGTAQDDYSLAQTKVRLREALRPRAANPPLVMLMSRSSRIDAKKDEFRDEVGLIDSAFRIVRKTELDTGDKFETQLARLAENAGESRKLAQFFYALDAGLGAAMQRALKLLRKLKLSDIGQIQQLLLNAEGEAVGSYLVDIFDRILLHEIEGEAGIIDAAVPLNEFRAVRYPPPYLAGSPELQDLVQRTLTQHRNRLLLPGSESAKVTFGDILQISNAGNEDRLKRELLVDVAADEVLLVLTPACDLQRSGVPRVLLLIGKVKPIQTKDWSYSDDARTSSISIGGENKWVKWDLKHIDTVSRQHLESALASDGIRVVARLREAHAIELQQRVLSGLGRVGLVARMPATFLVEVEAYYANKNGHPTVLDVPSLTDGAICFVGRGQKGEQVFRLVMTEGCVDGIHDALRELDESEIAESARKAFDHVKTSQDLRRMLSEGLDLKGVSSGDWAHIPSQTGQVSGIPKMGLIAWNYEIPEGEIPKKDLNKAGVILLVRDAPTPGNPGLEQVIRSGLVDPQSAQNETVQ
jgi:hypothetical protein